MLLWVVAGILVLILWCGRKEGFSVKISGDGDIAKSMHKGLKGLARNAFKQADDLKNTAVSMVPFKSTLRQWHRHYFKKNIGVVYA